MRDGGGNHFVVAGGCSCVLCALCEHKNNKRMKRKLGNVKKGVKNDVMVHARSRAIIVAHLLK